MDLTKQQLNTGSFVSPGEGEDCPFLRRKKGEILSTFIIFVISFENIKAVSFSLLQKNSAWKCN